MSEYIIIAIISVALLFLSLLGILVFNSTPLSIITATLGIVIWIMFGGSIEDETD